MLLIHFVSGARESVSDPTNKTRPWVKPQNVSIAMEEKNQGALAELLGVREWGIELSL